LFSLLPFFFIHNQPTKTIETLATCFRPPAHYLLQLFIPKTNRSRQDIAIKHLPHHLSLLFFSLLPLLSSSEGSHSSRASSTKHKQLPTNVNMSNAILGDKDVNASLADNQAVGKDVKSMEYHRQVFQSKMNESPSKTYVSPSDGIMSPASAKIKSLRNKHASKAKPKSLFAQASVKRLEGDGVFGARSVAQ
jgi:hypothetical protein